MAHCLRLTFFTTVITATDGDGNLVVHRIEPDIFYRYVNKNKVMFIDRIVLVSNPSSIVILTQ